jgi:Glycosyltransferase 61
MLMPTRTRCAVGNVHLLMAHRQHMYERVPGLERVKMQRNRVLVATRRDGRRQLRDADTVLDALRSRFPFADVVEFHSHGSVADDYRLVRSAAVFVCVHGAAGLNAELMHDGAQFIELHPHASHLMHHSGVELMPRNMWLCAELGIDYGAVRRLGSLAAVSQLSVL